MRRPSRFPLKRHLSQAGFGLFLLVAGLGLSLYWPMTPRKVPGELAPALEPLMQKNRPRSLPEADFYCRVERINDGDTLRCADGTRVRLHAVAARETDGTCSPGHPCPTASAEAATRELQRLARGQTLACLETGTSFNRINAICWTQAGVEINCAMVSSGTALVWPRFNAEKPICRI